MQTSACPPPPTPAQIHNGWDSQNAALIVALNHVVMFASDRGFLVPVPVRALGGDLVSTEMLPIAATPGAGGGGGGDDGGKSEM